MSSMSVPLSSRPPPLLEELKLRLATPRTPCANRRAALCRRRAPGRGQTQPVFMPGEEPLKWKAGSRGVVLG